MSAAERTDAGVIRMVRFDFQATRTLAGLPVKALKFFPFEIVVFPDMDVVVSPEEFDDRDDLWLTKLERATVSLPYATGLHVYTDAEDEFTGDASLLNADKMVMFARKLCEHAESKQTDGASAQSEVICLDLRRKTGEQR